MPWSTGKGDGEDRFIFYSTACLNVWPLLLYNYKRFVASYGRYAAADFQTGIDLFKANLRVKRLLRNSLLKF